MLVGVNISFKNPKLSSVSAHQLADDQKTQRGSPTK